MSTFRTATVHEDFAHLRKGLTGAPLVKNWPYNFTSVQRGHAAVYVDAYGQWLSMGSNGTDTLVMCSPDGQRWQNRTNITGFAITRESAYVVPGTSIVRVGGDPAGSSGLKMRESSNLGQSWSLITVGGADTESITAVAYTPAFGGLAGGSQSAHIYHSPNGSSGYTLVNTGVGVGIAAFAVREDVAGVRAVAITFASNTYYWSDNGTSWSSAAWPNAEQPFSITYNRALRMWFAISNFSKVYASSTGTSWTVVSDVGASGNTISRISECDTALLAYYSNPSAFTGIAVSLDQGVTWNMATSIPHNGLSQIAVARRYKGPGNEFYPPHQVMATRYPEGDHYASLIG